MATTQDQPPYPDRDLRERCSRFLLGHGPSAMRGYAERLLASPELDLARDEYGEGPAMQRLEAEVAGLLGKEAALFFSKGVIAQQAALLVHAARTNRRSVAVHPKSHLALDEDDALDRLSGLATLRLGPDHRPFGPGDLASVTEPLAAVSVELPLRRAGFLAADRDELVAISTWARERGVPFHLDGARIWEAQPWYGRPLAEIAGLADTVYVSFYKGLGGLGGAVLAGPRDVIQANKVWRNRFGGTLYTAFPMVLTALDGLHRHLPRMAEYHRHAVSIAEAVSQVPGLAALPHPPRSNSFQVHFDAPAADLARAATAVARERGWWLMNRIGPTSLPGRSFGEIFAGEATLGWDPAEVAETMADLLKRATSS